MKRIESTTVALIIRIILGGVLVVAGGLKITEPSQAARAAQAYQILPFDLAGLVGMMLPIAEVSIGILLLLGLYTRFASAATSVLMLVFTAAIISAWVRGISIDCGCFGGGGEAQPDAMAKYPYEIARDLILAAMAAWLAVRPASKYSIDDAE